MVPIKGCYRKKDVVDCPKLLKSMDMVVMKNKVHGTF